MPPAYERENEDLSSNECSLHGLAMAATSACRLLHQPQGPCEFGTALRKRNAETCVTWFGPEPVESVGRRFRQSALRRKVLAAADTISSGTVKQLDDRSDRAGSGGQRP